MVPPTARRRLAELFRSDSLVRETVSQELELYAARLRPGENPRCDDVGVLTRLRGDRAARLNAIDPQLLGAESALERVEGTARYVEETAYDTDEVAQLFRSREPGWGPGPGGHALKRRLAVSEGEYYYATGYALARILDGCNPRWKRSFGGNNLFELIGEGRR